MTDGKEAVLTASEIDAFGKREKKAQNLRKDEKKRKTKEEMVEQRTASHWQGRLPI